MVTRHNRGTEEGQSAKDCPTAQQPTEAVESPRAYAEHTDSNDDPSGCERPSKESRKYSHKL